LPDTSEGELISKIRQKVPGIPVIAQIGDVMEKDRSKGLDAGCDDYINQSFSPEQLLAKVQGYI